VKFIDEFRDGKLARGLAAAIRQSARDDRDYHFMEFCGGHTHAISRYGVSDLLPSNVRMIHGPGCPVCVLPIGRIDMAIVSPVMPASSSAATAIRCACRPPAGFRCSRRKRGWAVGRQAMASAMATSG
jgi:hydrogenase expression/formation protein HypD